MADFKRRTLTLSSGKQIRFFGNSIAISKSLQLGEGGAPNIFSTTETAPEEKLAAIPGPDTDGQKAAKAPAARKTTVKVSNPHNLTQEEMMEIADFNIRLWLDLKDNIRRFGVNDARVFNREALL